MKFEFTLVGDKPLLPHADDVVQADLIDDWRKDPDNQAIKKAGDDRVPAWTWQAYLYHDGNQLIWPFANIMKGLAKAGVAVPLPNGKRGKSCKEITQNGISAIDECFEFLHKGKPVSMADILGIRELSFAKQSAAVKKMGFDLFVKRVAIGTSKHIRVRAMFPPGWIIRGRMEVMPQAADVLSLDLLTRIFEKVGSGGQGDWRPTAPKSPGPFGRATAKLKKIG